MPDSILGRVRVAVLTVAAALLWSCSASVSRTPVPPAAAIAWARLGTADAHSLAFAPGDAQHLFFGHHGGVLESVDGGRTWAPLGARADAMSMDIGDGTTMYIAGHEVFQVSRDGGETWASPDTDLPNLDIHAFTRDPADPARMWAYLADGGVYESADGGDHWRLVYEGHIPLLAAIRAGNATELLGLDPFEGLARSFDGGATWSVVSAPPGVPVVSLAATSDGRVVLLGVGDGLYRSDDGGTTWRRILAVPLPLAVAVTPDAAVVAAVTRQTDFYRSDDGGSIWPGP